MVSITRRLLLLAFLIPALACASVTAATVFEVRTAGSDTNGGGFDPTIASAGTDMSQFDNKNAASCTNCQSATVNISTTDAVANGTTTLVSATGNFSSALVGNVLYFTGGTGSIAGTFRQVTGFTNSTTVTIDASIAASTGMTMNIGGAFLSSNAITSTNITFAASAKAILWIKAGTFTITTTWNMYLNSSGNVQLTLDCYTSSRGDGGTGCTIQTSTNSVDLLTATSSATYYKIRGITTKSTASTRGICYTMHNSNINTLLLQFTADGCHEGVNGDNSGARYPCDGLVLQNSEIKNSTTQAITCESTSRVTLINSYIHDNTGNGVVSSGGPGTSAIYFACYGSVISGNTSNGAFFQPIVSDTFEPYPVRLQNCVFANNGGAGIKLNNATAVQDWLLYAVNNVFYGNTTYGVDLVNAAATNTQYFFDYNAYGSNTTANLHNLTAGSHDITLSANPWVSSTNWGLNSTAGGGAALSKAGFPGSVFAAGTTGYADINAVQTTGGVATSTQSNHATIH